MRHEPSPPSRWMRSLQWGAATSCHGSRRGRGGLGRSRHGGTRALKETCTTKSLGQAVPAWRRRPVRMHYSSRSRWTRNDNRLERCPTREWRSRRSILRARGRSIRGRRSAPRPSYLERRRSRSFSPLKTHRQAFETELEFAGIDVVEARRTGRLVTFDAASTITQFMVDGQIDRKAVRSVLGGILDEASGAAVRCTSTAKWLHSSGTQVTCWPLSNWNRYGTTSSRASRSHSFVLIRVRLSRDLSRLRHCGRSVISTRPWCRAPLALTFSSALQGYARGQPTLRPSWAQPAAARRFVRDVLLQWGHADEDLLDEVAFVVSELATNAVVHAGSAFSVGIRVLPAPQLVRVRSETPARLCGRSVTSHQRLRPVGV